MSKFLKTLTFVSTLYTTLALGQVKGVVTDESGLPLPGVSVLIKGTQNGTQSNMDGQFEIDAKDGQVLVFSFIGMESKEVPATNAPMKITLDDTINTLQEVVVTALGIKREKKALGYSQQQIKGEEINNSGQTNVLTGLSGNVAGVQVTAPSSMGGSNRITLRGINSISGNNKPLIVVDGIPFDNSNFNTTGTQNGSGGRDYGDTSADINPEDIESVTVLKGAAAAALYGSRAQNGVIMYTTKSAKKGKSEVAFKTGVDLQTVYIMPKLQNEYGGGYVSSLPTQMINGTMYNIAEYNADESWGPKYDSNLMYLPWNAFDPTDPQNYLKEKAWVKSKNDVKTFFNTGVTTNNSVSLSHATDKNNIRLSYTNQLTNGIVPNSNLSKNMLSLNGGAKLNDKLKFDAMMSYTDTKGFNRPEQGYGDNSVAQKFFQWGQRQLDMNDLKRYQNAIGEQQAWNRYSWDNPTPAYSDNPYWTIYKNTSEDRRHRIYGNIKLQYDFTDYLYAVANVYGDHYDFKIGERVAVGSQAQSYYEETKYLRSEFNYEFRLHFNKKFNDFSVNAFAGVNKRRNTGSQLTGYTSGGLIIPNFYDLTNSVNLARSSKYESIQTINSMYAMASVGYKDLLFLEGTVRKDYFSTVNKAGVYPSVTGSFIFSQLPGLKDLEWLNFGKIRAAWAQVSNGANPYSLRNYYNVDRTFQGIPTYTIQNTYNEANLKPETKTSKEIGLEMKFFDNRFGFDVAYYQDRTKDLITPLQISGSAGYQYKYMNIGELENKGIEATVFINPVRTEDFNWDIAWNFSKNNNKLLSLVGDAETYVITNAPFSVQLVAQVGQKYGQILGYDYTYVDGQKVVEDGLYKPGELKALGSVIPDYNMGIRNTFTYKNVTLSALIDIQKGGHYFSTSHMFGMYSGMLEESAANGIRENGIVLPGVNVDPVTKEVTQNTTVTDGYSYAANHYGGVDTQNVFDASYVKLREVTLGYSFPAKYFNNKISALRINAYARNLFAWGLDWKGMDPENTSYGSGNIQGLEGGSLPSVRSFGASLEIKL